MGENVSKAISDYGFISRYIKNYNTATKRNNSIKRATDLNRHYSKKINKCSIST